MHQKSRVVVVVVVVVDVGDDDDDDENEDVDGDGDGDGDVVDLLLSFSYIFKFYIFSSVPLFNVQCGGGGVKIISNILLKEEHGFSRNEWNNVD